MKLPTSLSICSSGLAFLLIACGGGTNDPPASTIPAGAPPGVLTFAIPDASAPGTSVNLVVKPIPAGTFTMGSPETEVGRYTHESPRPTVTLSPFYMGQFEVTQAQWKAVMNANPSHFSVAGGGSQTDDFTRPVEYVRYNDIITIAAPGFLDRLNALTAATRPSGLVFRLPTEAEWEYAARGGTTTRFYWGEDAEYTLISNYAWNSQNNTFAPHAVGVKLPNAYGLFDMSGNVAEFCQDWYGYYSAAPQTNPAGPTTGRSRVLRGGTWDGKENCRTASRNDLDPSFYNIYTGFRVVLAAPQMP